MNPMPVLCGHASRLALVMLLILGASGCEKKATPPPTPTPKPTPKVVVDLSCGPKQVDVNTDNGADPEVVYVCEDDTVSWNSHGYKFTVVFTGDSPFKDDNKNFDNTKATSDKAKYHVKHKYKLYEYRITVEGVEHDPQVLGGGKP